MITLTKVEQGIEFAFDNSSHYLFNGEIIVPVNSLSLVFDESDMATFYKAASNDIFISANIGEFGMTKAELEEWYASNMLSASEGVTPEEVEELIDDALLNYYDEDEIDTALSAKQDISGMTAYTLSSVTDALNTVVTAHTADTSIHVTQSEKNTWNSKQDISGMTAYTTTAVTDALNTVVTAHTANTNIHVSAEDKNTWNSKQDLLVSGTNIKTINNESLLGSGNIVIQGGGGTVDPSIDSGSTNPVENRAIYNKFDEVEQVTASALNVLNDKFGGLRLVKISQTDYENLPVKDNNTLYIVLED